MGGGGGSSKSTSTVYTNADPWSGVQPYLRSLYGNVDSLGNTPLEYYPGQGYVPMSGTTQQGINQNLNYVNNAFPSMYNAGMNTLGTLSNSMNVAANPYVQGMNQSLANQYNQASRQQIGDMGNTLYQQLGSGMTNLSRGLQDQQTAYGRMLQDTSQEWNNQIMPGITRDALTVGGLGGTRQGVAEGQAAGNLAQQYQRALQDITQSQQRGYQDLAWGMGNAYGTAGQSMRDVVSNSLNSLAGGIAQQNLGAYGQGLSAAQGALGMYPQFAELGLMPGQVYQQAGQMGENYQQKALEADMAKWDFYQNEPWNRVSNMNAIFSGATPYAQQSSQQTTSTPVTSNPWASGLAAASGAYGLYNGLMG